MEVKRKHPWLTKRGGVFYLRAKVPHDIVALYGKPEEKWSLRTRDPQQANSLIQKEAFKLQARFDALRMSRHPSPPVHHHITSERLQALARQWFDERYSQPEFAAPMAMDATRRASLVDDQRQELAAIIHDEPLEVGRSIEEAGRLLRSDPSHGQVDLKAISELADLLIRARCELLELKLRQLDFDYSDKVSDALFRQRGLSVRTKPDPADDTRQLIFALEPWLNFLKNNNMKSRQLRQYEADLRSFAEKIKTVSDVRQSELQSFYEKDIAHLSPNTIIRKFSVIRNYWKYLIAHHEVSKEIKPFEGLLLPAKKVMTKRRGWSPAELCDLWRKAQARSDGALADAIRIAAFTGSRIEAVCSLSISRVFVAQDGKLAFHFSDKTDAGIRDVPVHSAITPLIVSLSDVARRTDGFLIKADTKNQYEDRSTGIGKRFSRLKAEQGFGRDLNFHSIRRTVVKLLSKAGCQEAVAADIVGHEKPTMTFGVYLDEADIEEKRVWLEKALVYPDEAFMNGLNPTDRP